MPMRRLKNFLKDHHIDYSTIEHAPAYTAQQIAESAHIPGEMLAKTVIVKLDSKLAMIVLPANETVDLNLLKDSTGSSEVEIAREYEFSSQFPDCETGAMPPFGNLFDMDVYVAKELTEDEEIAFNAGSHSELIKMAYSDFSKLVKPKVIKIH